MRVLHPLAVIALLLALIAPLVPLAIWSLAHGWRFPDVLPQRWTGAAWAYALSPLSGVLGSLGVTLAIAAAVTLMSAAVGIPAGRALGLHEFRGKALVEAIILSPLIVPPLTVTLGLHGVFIGLGLTGTIWGVMLVHLIPALPYMILVLAGVFANFDPASESQARSLGASPAQVFRHVTLPAIFPGLLVAMLLVFLVSWSQYLLTLMIGGGRVVTLPMLLFNFATSGRNDIAGAIALIYILPSILLLGATARRVTGVPL